MFTQAYREGIITDLADCECASECEECPAGPACEQISNKGDYSTFVHNYKHEILPILKEDQNVD